MSKFKPGDRIQLKPEAQAQIRSMNPIVGTIRDVIDDVAYVVLDHQLMTYTKDGDKIYFQEGTLDKPLEKFFDVIEKSDWSSLWEDAADSTSDGYSGKSSS